MSLLPSYRVSSPDEIRLLHKEVAYGEIHGVSAALDTHAEHVVVNEVSIEHELDSLGTAERPALPKHTAEPRRSSSSNVATANIVKTYELTIESGLHDRRGFVARFPLIHRFTNWR